MYEEIIFKRDDLYEEVWSQPIIKLAQKYSISDVGLAKICKKLKIPLPGRGYWQKGQNKRVPLPPLKVGDLTTYTLRRERQDVLPLDDVQTRQAEELIDQLQTEKIKVPSRLVSSHPVVSRTKLALEAAKPDLNGRVSPWSDKSAFYVSVSKKAISRTMRILDALLKEFDARGFNISIEGERRYTYVRVLGQKIEISLCELNNKIEREFTESQKKELLESPWKYKKHEYVPSGRLELSMKNLNYWGSLRHKWADGKKQQLEDCLNDFMIGLIRASVVLRSVQLKWEREEKQRREQELKRIEEERKQREEKERLEALLREVDQWNKSRRIREYVEAVRHWLIQRDGIISPGSKADNWLSWAARLADRFDPLCPRDSDNENDGPEKS